MEQLDGIGAADALLGRRFPLPAVALPLARWSEVTAFADGVEVEWNLDDTRGGPGRLALLASATAPLTQLPSAEVTTDGAFTVRSAPLPDAQASLRPVVELAWVQGELHLRLTAQGPWERSALLAIARSVGR